jgi:hypothetical protein
MELATESRSRRALSVFLAGLQAGMLGALVFLAWMGVTAKLQQRSFWTFENLAASAFYGSGAIHRGFASSTVFGLALFLLLYSLLGAAFAAAVPVRMRRLWITLASILFALCWYYVTFRWMYRELAPVIALLHVEKTTAWGHAIYGLAMARYPAYLPKRGSVQTKASDAETQRRGDPPDSSSYQDPTGDRRA